MLCRYLRSDGIIFVYSLFKGIVLSYHAEEVSNLFCFFIVSRQNFIIRKIFFMINLVLRPAPISKKEGSIRRTGQDTFKNHITLAEGF